MIKLYKRIDGVLHYWETWSSDRKTQTVHWGKVGERGEDELVEPVKRGFFTTVRQEIERPEGYLPIALEEHRRLIIEFKVEGFGGQMDLAKRHALEDRMQETLGWTGLGLCDGGSIGSGTMEVCCFVVDFEIAKKIIAADLKGTEYEDFLRIYDEDAELGANP